MKLIFLGSGSAFVVGEKNYHSNILLEDSNKNRLLIDCGSDARHSLHALGLSYRDITDVYITHLHADHAGGLEWLAFTNMFDPDHPNKPRLYIAEPLVEKLWINMLSGGLTSLKNETASLSSYFIVHAIKNLTFKWQNLEFNLVQTIHISDDPTLQPTFGLFFIVDGISCFITADTQFTPQLREYYNKADIIFHECETSPKASGIHSHYSELLTLEPSIKAKMWLYHYNNGSLPDAKADGFCGFVKPGQCFDFLNKKTLK